MTADRNSSPAEAEMPPEGYVVLYGKHRSWWAYQGRDAISRWGDKASAIKACWGHADATPPAALTAAPKATEAPGLREAAAPFVKHYADWMDECPDDQEVSVYPGHTYGQIRALIAALSATPQPVAVPDDGAGRDGAWRYDIQYGPEGEANYAWVYDETGRMVGTMRAFHAATICALASALSAERAATGELLAVIHRDGGHYAELVGHDRARSDAVAIVVSERSNADAELAEARDVLRSERAEVARLRKALEEIAATDEDGYTLSGRDCQVLASMALAARSSREEGK